MARKAGPPEAGRVLRRVAPAPRPAAGEAAFPETPYSFARTALHPDAATDLAVAHRGSEQARAPLPWRPRIQRAFGHHDLSDVQTQTGSAAAVACHLLQATAYTAVRGSAPVIGFRTPPDLFTATHEAAHVVQQRPHFRLPAAFRQGPEPYERHADAVASRVVQHAPAADLLGDAGPTTTADTPPPVLRQEATPGADVEALLEMIAWADAADLDGSVVQQTVKNLSDDEFTRFMRGLQERGLLHRYLEARFSQGAAPAAQPLDLNAPTLGQEGGEGAWLAQVSDYQVPTPDDLDQFAAWRDWNWGYDRTFEKEDADRLQMLEQLQNENPEMFDLPMTDVLKRETADLRKRKRLQSTLDPDQLKPLTEATYPDVTLEIPLLCYIAGEQTPDRVDADIEAANRILGFHGIRLLKVAKRRIPPPGIDPEKSFSENKAAYEAFLEHYTLPGQPAYQRVDTMLPFSMDQTLSRYWNRALNATFETVLSAFWVGAYHTQGQAFKDQNAVIIDASKKLPAVLAHEVVHVVGGRPHANADDAALRGNLMVGGQENACSWGMRMDLDRGGPQDLEACFNAGMLSPTDLELIRHHLYRKYWWAVGAQK